MPRVERVAVVGGGAVGVTAASDLAAAGVDATLFERDVIAAGSTGRAAGIVYDAFADPLDAGIADRAIERFRALAGDGFAFEPTPYVWFAHEGDDRAAEAIREQADRMRANDRDVAAVAPADLGSRFPSLHVEDVAVAAVAENAACVDPGGYARTMADRARAAGATVRTGVEATLSSRGVDGEAFDAVLVAAGAHTGRVVADADVSLAVKPYRVQALTVPRAPDVPILYDATEGYYCRPHGDGLLAGDGTEPVARDPDDWERDADPGFVDRTRRRLEARIPGLDARVDDAWAGLCTATPDGDPLLGACRDRLYVATGWHGHGFMRAPATAERVAAELCGGEGIASFDPTRFTGDEEFEVVEGMAID